MSMSAHRGGRYSTCKQAIALINPPGMMHVHTIDREEARQTKPEK